MTDDSLDDDIRAEFRAESQEHLLQLEASLLDLERRPSDLGTINQAFRSAHSLKGAAGFLGRADIERLTHAAEDLLDLLRQGAAQIDAPATGALLAATDRCAAMLDAEPLPEDDPGLLALRGALLDHHARLSSPAPKPGQGWVEIFTAPLPSAARAPRPAGEPATEELFRWAVSGPEPAAELHPNDVAQAIPAEAVRPPALGLVDEAASAELRRPPPGALAQGRRERSLQQLVEALGPTAAPPAPSPPPAAKPPTEPKPEPVPAQAHADPTIRVDVSLLDDIMNIVGELVVARNRLMRALGQGPQETQKAARRLDQLTSELQARATKTRMRPVSAAWAGVPRTVRDLCSDTGKQVRLIMLGQETELDRSLLEALKDPLQHIIRNSIDHGIERPEDRVAVGKPPTGTLSLAARHSGGVVLIEVTDDGKGIDPAAILESAVRKGLLSEAEARGLSASEALELVFLPGFSTATAVTRLSGRGVGMDVVRTQLRQVGGAVDLQSVKGAGTTLRLRLPLTLAIVPALVVEANGRTFCVPQANLVEIVDTVRLEPSRLQRVGGAAVLRLRDQLLPLVHLGGALGLGPPGGPAVGAEGGAPCGTIVVCEADGGRLGLIVDALQDTEEIVVKPLSPELKQQGIWAGATVRGDGSVTLILDIAGLGTRARALGAPAPTAAVQRAAPVDPMLRVAVAGVGQVLIPLHPVLRCDDLQDITLHTQGALLLVTYDGDLVPVRPLTDELRAVVIFERGGARFALGVTEVLDVFAEPTRLTPGLGPAWAKASGLVRGSPAALVDLDTIAAELSR